MYKFFVEDYQVKENKVNIIEEDKKHIANVLRMKIKEKILVTNKTTLETYECEIKNIDKEKVECNILKKIELDVEPKVKVDIYQGLPKSDKLEYIIQKSVELGVNKIIPVNMEYCISKIKDGEKKNERWMKISEAAAKQSKRNIIPKVEKSVDMNYVYEQIKNYDLVLVLYENEEKTTIKEVLQRENNINNIAVIIGPEGGISKKEIEKLEENGAKIVTLGKRILRTETAPVTVLSIIMYEYD